MFTTFTTWDSFIIDSPSILSYYLEMELVTLCDFSCLNVLADTSKEMLNSIKDILHTYTYYIWVIYILYIFRHVKIFIIFLFLHCFYPEWVLNCVKSFSKASVITIIRFFSLDWSISSCFILMDVLILSRLAHWNASQFIMVYYFLKVCH